jgi:hypothetical protein
MRYLSNIARKFYVFVAIILLIGLLPLQRASGQSTVQAPYIGIWISAQELASLPTSGAAWTSLLNAANADPGIPDIKNQDSDNDVYVLAKALVYARTGDTNYRSEVISNLQQAIGTEVGGRTLALGRNLVSYVIAADLVNLPTANPSFDSTFRTWLREILTKTLDKKTLISTHEDRPNNWGTHAGASRAAVARYLGDQTQLDRTAIVFQGWLGNRSVYAGFTYGDDLSWQCDSTQPVGINPLGCTKDGINIDGALPEEMRRGGVFKDPPTFTGYPWEAMQGAMVQGLILQRAGYPVLEWSDRALLRAAQYLYRIGWAPTGDDLYLPWLINYAYGTSYATDTAFRGKNMGWTDWTHAGRTISGDTTPPPSTLPTFTPTATQQPTATATQQPSPTATSTPIANTTIKSITFENGKIKHPITGVDRVIGSPTIVKSGALSGKYSLGFENTGSAYVEEDFAAEDVIFVSFLLKINSLPSTDTRILFFSNQGQVAANIVLANNGSLRLGFGASSIGSASPALAANTVYRVGLYQKRGSGSNAAAAAYLAPEGQSFGAPFAEVANGSWTNQANMLTFGATDTRPVNIVFDNLILGRQFTP